ncbi:hypothetical protein DPMN_126140 [Dreissena polymorpha]|uniref:Uncharacterized protein n=1 Tax=Dreissena polymorpha TaxID=45954 RepID=A0A9D4GZH6_DREPO|nr:hypothetical protein DPMN_126140 [Dreissena polymorpha]
MTAEDKQTVMFTENTVVRESEACPGFEEFTTYTYRHTVTVSLVKVEKYLKKCPVKSPNTRQKFS